MSLTLNILKKAELFLSLAVKDIEKTRAARRKWFANLQEKGKANPNDPDYQNYLAHRREYYDTTQQLLDTDPEALDAYLDDQANRQQRFRAKLKQDPNKLKSFQENKREDDRIRLEKARQGNDLESKVLLFGRQIAFKRSDEKKKFNNKPFPEYESNKKQLDELTDYINQLRSFMYGPKEGKLISNLEFLVSDGLSRAQNILPLSPKLSNNLLEIVDMLETQLTEYKST